VGEGSPFLGHVKQKIKGKQLYYLQLTHLVDCLTLKTLNCGGGATRLLPRDGGVEELHGDPTCTAPTSRRLNVVVRSSPLYARGWPKWRDNYPEGPSHPVAPNRLKT